MPGSIKIIHVVHGLDIGGLENGLVNLLNQLDEQFDHTILCLSKSGRMAQRIKNRDIRIIEMGLPTNKFRFPVLKLAKVFRQIKPDIVHTRGWSSVDAIMAARVAQVTRVIHGEHGWEASDPEGQNRKRNFIRKSLSPMVDRFVTVSDDLKRWLIQIVGIPDRKVVTIHNGVDTDKFIGDGRDAARRMLGLDAATFVFGTVGRLDPVKDHGSLLQAFAAITQVDQRARLVIVGDGPMRAQIESKVAALAIGDRVCLLGERSDVHLLLKAFDVFALTSIAEGISNTILEAMASGLAIIATRVGGNPELIQDGISGQLVEARDINEMTIAFGNYLSDLSLCARHGLAARTRVMEKFSLKRMSADYAAQYHSLIRRELLTRA
jgi:sugar transferase (PEP-CTERM/EpsH1 system associated)